MQTPREHEKLRKSSTLRSGSNLQPWSCEVAMLPTMPPCQLIGIPCYSKSPPFCEDLECCGNYLLALSVKMIWVQCVPAVNIEGIWNVREFYIFYKTKQKKNNFPSAAWDSITVCSFPMQNWCTKRNDKNRAPSPITLRKPMLSERSLISYLRVIRCFSLMLTQSLFLAFLKKLHMIFSTEAAFRGVMEIAICLKSGSCQGI